MEKKKNTTVSLANTPVRRALAKAKRSTLFLVFAAGLVLGFVYKAYSADENPPAALRQR